MQKQIDYLGIMRPVKVVVFINDADLVKLVEKSSNIFQSLKRGKLVIEGEIKHFACKYMTPINFEKMCLLPNILKRLVVVPGHLAIVVHVLRKLLSF